MITRITKKPLRGAAIEAELCRLGDEQESCKQVTLKLSGLPHGTTKERVEMYFEDQGDNVKVLSVKFQGPGSAKTVLFGLTVEGMTALKNCLLLTLSMTFSPPTIEVKRLQQKKHKIMRQIISVEVVEITTVMELSQSDDVDFTLPTTITVSGFPDSVDEELLKIFFESSKSGGREGAVEHCSIVAQGIAHVKFHSPDSKICNLCNSIHCGIHILSTSSMQLQLRLSPSLGVTLSVAPPYVSDTMTRVSLWRDTRVTGSKSTSFPQELGRIISNSILMVYCRWNTLKISPVRCQASLR